MTNKNSYEDHKPCEPDRDCAKCKPKHPKPQKIILECGEGTGRRTFTSSNDTPFQLAHVTLDTTYLNKPEVLIKFSSIVFMVNLVQFDNQLGTARLQYELFRVCDDEEPTSLGVWMFEEVNVENGAFDRQEESFDFIFCECRNFSRCCEYFVIVTPVEITNATVTVSNGRMAALSQSVSESLGYEHKASDQRYNDFKFKQKHPKPKEILLSCGRGNGSIVFREAPELDPPADIAHVTIDTTCLDKPKVVLAFSSIIKLDAFVGDVRLQFELFRVCGDGESLSRGIWTFERSGALEFIELDKVFNFTYCECEAPRGCCEYFVTVTPIVIDSNDVGADIDVDNARMLALAQSSRHGIYYNDCKTFDEKGDCTYSDPKSPNPKKIILECGEGTGSRTFTSSDDPAFQLAHVTIDTTCLCRPMVNIEFSSIVSFEQVTSSFTEAARLRYELFRVCDNKRPISVGIWTLERLDFDSIGRSTNIFSFTFCDCITCPGCCEYFVTVTPVIVTEGAITATVSNGRIAALAQGI